MSTEEEGVRLQKVLAAAGIASRRASENLIFEGRVEVNGKVVTEQGMRVDPYKDVVRVDGARVPPPRNHVYVVMNKPRGVVSTMDDPEGRPTLDDYLGKRRERLFHVGRLDTDTEGLLIMTNDGDFAHKLAHPKYQIGKTYLAEVSGQVERETIKRLRNGITLDDGPVKPDSVKVVSVHANKTLVQITLREGRNRIVRRTLEHVGHPVRKLSRIGIGPVRLGNLKVGTLRDLTSEELGVLLDLIQD